MQSINLFGEMQEFDDRKHKIYGTNDFRKKNYYRKSGSPTYMCCGICAFVFYKRFAGKGSYSCKKMLRSNCDVRSNFEVHKNCICNLWKVTK
jgi:hypothetical protein